MCHGALVRACAVHVWLLCVGECHEMLGCAGVLGAVAVRSVELPTPPSGREFVHVPRTHEAIGLVVANTALCVTTTWPIVLAERTMKRSWTRYFFRNSHTAHTRPRMHLSPPPVPPIPSVATAAATAAAAVVSVAVTPRTPTAIPITVTPWAAAAASSVVAPHR